MKPTAQSSPGARNTTPVRARPLPTGLKLRDGRIIEFPAIMGVLNVTPDSFSDGGRYLDPQRAVEHALAMEADGADIIDVGGESTRPVGAREVPLEVELERVTPVLQRLGRALRIPISIDTRRSAVAAAALSCGAAIINDISALKDDPAMAALLAREKCCVVLMHMRGGPADHIKHAHYRDVVREVARDLGERARFALKAGIARSRIIIDPGIGFAKNTGHNLKLIAALPTLCALGYPILVGASRKTFVRRIAGAGERELEFGSAAVNVIAIANGASILRVHDVAAARSSVAMAAAIAAASRGGRRSRYDA